MTLVARCRIRIGILPDAACRRTCRLCLPSVAAMLACRRRADRWLYLLFFPPTTLEQHGAPHGQHGK
jgi:hypothetical protein